MKKLGFILPLLSCDLFLTGSFAAAQDRPNILVIFADDVGFWNVSLRPGCEHTKSFWENRQFWYQNAPIRAQNMPLF